MDGAGGKTLDTGCKGGGGRGRDSIVTLVLWNVDEDAAVGLGITGSDNGADEACRTGEVKLDDDDGEGSK